MPTLMLPLCLTFATVLSPQGPPAATTELIPLAHLAPMERDDVRTPWLTLLNASDGVDLLGADGAEEPVSAALVDGLLFAHRGAVEGGLQLTMLESTLAATGGSTEIARIKDHVRQVSAIVARPLQIECALWDAADRETPAATLTTSDYARVFANLAPQARGVAVGKPNTAVAIQRMRWTRYVRALDAEVAQKQSATRPATEQFGEGLHAIVQAFPLLGGDEFAVHVQFVAGQRRGPVRTMQTGLAGAADLELPLLETDCGTFSGRIPNGGCLVATLRGHASGGGQRLVTVRITSTPPPAKYASDELGVYPCGALTSHGLLARPRPTSESPDASATPSTGCVPVDDLEPLLRAGAGGDVGSVVIQHGYAFVRAPAAQQAAFETALRALQDRVIRGATVRHVAALQPADKAGGATVPTLHELAAPTLLGRQLTLSRRLETNVVADVWISIAQEASTLSPGVEPFHSGTWLSARISPQDDGANLQLVSYDQHGLVPVGRSVMPGAVLMQPELVKAASSHDGPIASGQRVDHGDGPTVTLDGRTYRCTLTTETRW